MDKETSDRHFDGLADFLAKLSALKFDAIGMIEPSKDGISTSIGPLFPCTRSDILRRWFGPFKSNRDRYLAQINHVLDCIVHKVVLVNPIPVYLVHLKLREMVSNDPDLAREETEFFISHQDASGDHILVEKDAHITGIIDWEW